MMVWKALPHQAINTDPYIAQHDIDRGNITHTPQYTIHPIAERLTHEAYEAKHGQAMPEWDNYHMGSIARVAPRRDEVGRIITIPASNGNPEMQVDENWWQDKLMRDETEPYRQFFDNMTPEDEEDMALFIGQQASGDSDYQLPSTDWQDKKTGEPMDIALRLLKASMPGTAGYPEDEPCSMCGGKGVLAADTTHEGMTCGWCKGSGKEIDGKRANWEDLRNQTLRDAAPVKPTDEHGFSDEERAHLEENLGHRPQYREFGVNTDFPSGQFEDEAWQNKLAGEPMDIAWQLLKAAFFTPKSGYEDEKDYPKRAVIPPTWGKEHFFNRVGVAGGGDREAKFREAQHDFPLKRYPRWPHSEGEEGVKDAGERPIDTKTMFDFIGGAEREGETYQERIQRIRDFLDNAKFRSVEYPPNVEGSARQDMRPGWKFGAGGRKEETAVGDEAWDRMRLPTGMFDIPEGEA